MTNEQLYLAIGIPAVLNIGLIGLLMAYINAKFEGVEKGFAAVNQRFAGVDQQFASVDQRFDDIGRRFDRLDQRFDDMRDLWRSELHRVEEVLDARLKHLEER